MLGIRTGGFGPFGRTWSGRTWSTCRFCNAPTNWTSL